MKILIVAMTESIHTVRWINQIIDQGWDIHLFPATGGEIHKDLKNITVHPVFYYKKSKRHRGVRYQFPNYFVSKIHALIRLFLRIFFRRYLEKSDSNRWERELAKLIKKLKPDIIHSLEFTYAGYLVAKVKRNFKGNFPKWIVTNWGSDIYLFGRLAAHRGKIKKVLENCDYYSCECHRDVCLANSAGLKGKILPVFPNTGGFNLKKMENLRRQVKTSKRKTIVLKGYQGLFGRALFGLKALEMCTDLLRDYQIIIFSAPKGSEMMIASELFTQNTGIETKIIPIGTPHQEILKLHSRARISLGLSISDAISTSFLEAMVMGSFPIQSNTACVDEWIENGRTGLIVAPEDTVSIAQAIRRALTDDKLVDEAAQENWRTVQERLDEKILQDKTIKFYEQVYNDKNKSSKSV